MIKTSFIKVNTYASLPFSENFETTWINRAGVRDVPSLYWDNIPATGNSSWNREDDGNSWSSTSGSYSPDGANGTNHSSRFHSYDALNGDTGILDLDINFSTAPLKDTLTFYYINTSGSDSLEVFLSTNGGLNFTKVGSQTTHINWTKIIIGLGNVSATNGVVRFKATSNNGASDIGLDEVKITGALSNQTSITAYSLPGQTGNANINVTARTIDITMPYGSSVSSLAAAYTLSAGATAKIGTTAQVSGTTTNDFTSAKTYIVTAQDGTTTQNWTVTVTVSKNNQTDITAFTVPSEIGATTINATDHTIAAKVLAGTNMTNIVATFTLSSSATAKVLTTAQVSGTTPNNFTNALTYIITAEDGTTTQNWTVTITANNPNDVANLESGESAIVYPNPSSGLFRVKLNTKAMVQMEVYNLAGSKIIDQRVEPKGDQNFPVDLTGSPAGIYLLQILTKEKAIQVKLVVR
jgi:hypothetical protein